MVQSLNCCYHVFACLLPNYTSENISSKRTSGAREFLKEKKPEDWLNFLSSIKYICICRLEKYVHSAV